MANHNRDEHFFYKTFKLGCAQRIESGFFVRLVPVIKKFTTWNTHRVKNFHEIAAGLWIRIQFLRIRINLLFKCECGFGSSLKNFVKNFLIKSFLYFKNVNKTYNYYQFPYIFSVIIFQFFPPGSGSGKNPENKCGSGSTALGNSVSPDVLAPACRVDGFVQATQLMEYGIQYITPSEYRYR